MENKINKKQKKNIQIFSGLENHSEEKFLEELLLSFKKIEVREISGEGGRCYPGYRAKAEDEIKRAKEK